MSEKEYIERGDAINIITMGISNAMSSERAIAYSDITRRINAIPSADVEPVVRCGNCEHSAINEYADDIDESPYYCFHLDCGVETNGFCSSGKKRARMERSGDA